MQTALQGNKTSADGSTSRSLSSSMTGLPVLVFAIYAATVIIRKLGGM